MTRPEYDVAIVGASIAGCTAATLFARGGLRVALLESRADPNAYKRVCTHFIQASATPTIERLGVAQAIEAAGGIRNGIDIWTRWGWIRREGNGGGRYPGYGYNIRRETLDPMLRRLAASTPGVDLLPGHVAERLFVDGGRIVGVGARRGDETTRDVNARLVVAADGRQSRIAELALVPPRVKAHNRFGYFAYYRGMSLRSGTKSQMWFLEPDIAYTFPNDGGLTLLACMPTKDKLAGFKANVETAFELMFRRLPEGPSLAHAERASGFLGMVEMPNLSRRPTLPGLAFIGDAALATDPVWGVGCGWAFQSAEWLVDCVGNALATDRLLDRGLARYARRHRAALAAHDFLICDYATGRSYNALERLMYSAAARDPAAARHFQEFGARNISVGQFLSPRALARALWVNAGHWWRSRRPKPTGRAAQRA